MAVKTPTQPKGKPKPVLEKHYNIKRATVQLGLSEEGNEDDKRGQKWLRDGCNRPEDGSKGPQFPHTRMANQLMFSESDLAWIAEQGRNKPHGHTRRPRRVPRQRRPRKTLIQAPITATTKAERPAA